MSSKEFRCFGPPGTGKTEYQRRQAERAAETHGPEGVLIASLTRAAAKEIAGRLSREKRSEWVGTLHAICYRMAGNPKIAEGELKSWNEWATKHCPSMRVLGRRESSLDVSMDPHGFQDPGGLLLAKYGALRARMIPEAQWPRTVVTFHEHWVTWKQENSLWDFTDLIEWGLTQDPPPGVRVGLFDEAQDFSTLELSLVRAWAPKLKTVILSGDDDQAIYGFRGADGSAFLDPPVPDDQIRVLGQSYRLPSKIKEHAESWIRRLARRQEKEFLARVDGGKIDYTGVTRKVPEIIAMAAESEARSGEVMILASCRYMLKPMVAVMRKLGIPFHNPYRPTEGTWNPLRGGAARLAAFLKPDPECWGGQNGQWTWGDLNSWFEVVDVNRAKLVRGAKTLVKKKAEDEFFRDIPPQLSELWSLFKDSPPPVDTAWFEEALSDTWKPRMRFALDLSRRAGRRALHRKPRIILGTIHSVKGGQCDTTFLFPDYSPASLPEPESRRRLFYVGMTRCREKLLICAPGGLAERL